MTLSPGARGTPAGPGGGSGRRHALAVGLLAGLLVAAWPALQLTGRYSGDELATFYVLVAVALGCHAAERRDRAHLDAVAAQRPRRPGWPPSPGERLGPLPVSAGDAARILVLFINLSLLLVGLSELGAGLAGQTSTTTSGVTLGARDQVAGGALVSGAGLAALAVYLLGSSRIPGLRRLRQDQPISWFAVTVVLHSFAQLLSPTSGTQSVASTIARPTGALDLVTGSLPFGIIALLAVGPVVDRPVRPWLRRLGLLPVRLPGWAVGAAAGLLLVPAVDWLFTPLMHLVPSDCAAQQEQVQQSLAGGRSGRSWEANLGIAAAAGTDEELLFRGVVQPRFGLLLSSLLFGAFHLQYTCRGLPSIGDLEIVALGVAFGLLRRHAGLPAAILAHVAYDASILLGGTAPGVTALLLIPLAGVAVLREAGRGGGVASRARAR